MCGCGMPAWELGLQAAGLSTHPAGLLGVFAGDSGKTCKNNVFHECHEPGFLGLFLFSFLFISLLVSPKQIKSSHPAFRNHLNPGCKSG